MFLQMPLINNTLSYLVHTNVKTTHNKHIFQKTHGKTFTFLTQDIHLYTCPFHFRVENVPKQTTSLHNEPLFKRHISRIKCKELCNTKWFCK